MRTVSARGCERTPPLYSIGRGTAANIMSLPKPGIKVVLPTHALHAA
jgi:hypothetical protein